MSTDHTARPYSWEYAAAYAPGLACYDCILELRARVERLEQAQQPARSPLVSHFRGVALVPPIECPDPQSWIAERIYEMGKADAEQQAQQQPAPSTPAGQGELVNLVAELIAHFASTSLVGDDCTPAARRLIIAVVIWLESQAWRGAADALRREVGR